MSSKFLSSLSSFSVLTNGEASLYIKDLKVENLNGNQNVSTNSEGSLISTENVIDTLKNGNENLDLGSTKTNYIDLKHYTPGNPLSNAVRLYSKSDNNIYYKDSLGNEISIGQSNVFDQNLNTTDNVQFSGLNMSSNTITNIGAGINPTDAVNLSQLNSISSNIIKPHYFTFNTVFSGITGTFNFNGPTPSTASQIRMTILDEAGENLLYIIERANNTLILIIRSGINVKIFRLTNYFGSGGYRTINYQFITESNTAVFSNGERCSFEFQYNPFNQNLGVENVVKFNQLTTPTIKVESNLSNYILSAGSNGITLKDQNNTQIINYDDLTYPGIKYLSIAGADRMYLGDITGTNLISFNNNLIHDVADGVDLADAVNFNQLQLVSVKSKYQTSTAIPNKTSVFTSDVEPLEDNTWDLGGSDYHYFKNIHFAGGLKNINSITTETYSKQWSVPPVGILSEGNTKISFTTAGGYNKFISAYPIFMPSSSAVITFKTNVVLSSSIKIYMGACSDPFNNNGIVSFLGQGADGTLYNNGGAVSGSSAFWKNGNSTNLVIDNGEWYLQQGGSQTQAYSIQGTAPFFLCLIEDEPGVDIEITIENITTSYIRPYNALTLDGQIKSDNATGYMLTFSGDDRQNDVGGYLKPGNDKDFRLSALTLDSRQVIPHAGVLDRITYIRSNIGQTSPPGVFKSYVSIRVEKIDGTTPFLIICVIPEGRLFGVIDVPGNTQVDDGDAIAIYIDRTGYPNTYFMGRSTINVYIAPTNNKKAPNNKIAASQLISSYTLNTDLSVYDRLDTIDSLIRYNSTTNETEIQAPMSVIDF